MFEGLVFSLVSISQVIVNGIVDDSKHVGVFVDKSQDFLAASKQKS